MILNFAGNGPELPTVPLLYNIFNTDALRVAAQAVVAAACWWTLCLSVVRLIDHKRVRIVIRFTILALGLVAPIVSWNTTLLSESLTLSLTALLVATWLSFFQKESLRWAMAVVFVTLAWTLTRQADVIVGLLITVGALVAALGRHRSKLRGFVALMMILISAYSLVITSRNTQVENANVADYVADRILLNKDYTNWFVAHGMPYSPEVAADAGTPYGSNLAGLPSFRPWLVKDGARVYAEFVFSHPNYTLLGPLSSFFGEVSSLTIPNTTVYPLTVMPNPTPSILSPTIDYGRYREVVPPIFGDILFEQGQAGAILSVVGIAGYLLYLSRRRYGIDRRQRIPCILLASVVPQAYFAWLSGGVGELDRLSMVTAASLRIGLVLCIAFSIDRLLSGTGLDQGDDGSGKEIVI